MELIERAGFLTSLQSQFENVIKGEGHCILLSGEAGIGKTSLVKTFCNDLRKDYKIYQGTCDALFTPRPLAPLYDILSQMGKGFSEFSIDIADRTAFFTRFFHELQIQKEASLIVFEDIHWADEATLDFIKFLARRITQLRCLFILTYRDDEIHSRHPLRNVLGQLNPDSFTRIQLLPLSRQAVDKMAEEKGFNGEDVYRISGGNPFYVNEILASYSKSVPDNIKDSILSVFNRMEDRAKYIWEILSVLPAGIRIDYIEKIEPSYTTVVEQCLDSKILIMENGHLFFKHELYRRTVELSLSPLLRVALNKKILDLLRENFEQNQEIEQIIHHAKNANEYDLVVYYAPIAAKQAACVGAHTEASRLYLTAIEYYQGDDQNTLIQFYESYAYECYLINQIREAIIYTGKSLNLWKKKNNEEKIGNSLRFLSRLWWFDGNRKQAESFGVQAIEVLDKQPSSKAKAMAYSNMSQLKMLSDEIAECIAWGEKATAIAGELNDEETISHALNSMGSALMTIQTSKSRGIELLQESMEIALRNSYHEHVARAYTSLGSNGVTLRDYDFARKKLDEGINYCEERDIDSWKLYMLAWKARLNLETGNWKEASSIADDLLKNENQSPVIKIGVLVVVATIKMRKGDPDALPLLLEAKIRAFETMELQRIIPALSALLEYEWITGETCIETKDLDRTVNMIERIEKVSKKNKFYYWLRIVRRQYLPIKERYEGYEGASSSIILKEAAEWEKLGCHYEQALTLFEGSDDDKRKAISIIHQLGATAVYEKMKFEMRGSGIKSIPRGIRKSTQSNPALLTDRELDVLQLLNDGMQNKEIASKLFISAKTVDHHISAILYKLEVKSRAKAVQEAIRLEIIK